MALGSFAGVDLRDDGVFSEPIQKIQVSKEVSASGEVVIPPLFGEEGVIIASLCSSSSPNLAKSRVNAMAGMAGVSVETDRMTDSAAWYVIPNNGLQWFDPVSTTFKSWMGTTNISSPFTGTEYGNRIIVHAFGKYPVSNYRCRVASTITNIVTMEFPVGTNTTTGMEIPFNANFVGIDTGTNGLIESFYNPSIATWVVGGDDKVYSNGELPSQVSYDWWYRFGATVSIGATKPSDFNLIKTQFVPELQSLSVSLIKNSVEIGKKTVFEARPKLLIGIYDQDSVIITVDGGQLWIPYQLWSIDNFTGASWSVYYQQALYSGQPVLVPKPDPMKYFRLITVMSP
ncbi:MAG: hypothetical protein WCW03_01580 [Candidatus Paceibacterota bacterium]